MLTENGDGIIFEGSFHYGFWSVVLMDGVAGADAYGSASESRQENRQTIGLARGVASISTPQQWNSAAPVSVFIRETFASDESTWDHVVEFDFDCATGTLAFGELDGPDIVSFLVPSGHYRARWSGRGYDEADAGAADDDISPDSYRLDLVSRTEPGPIVEIRRVRVPSLGLPEHRRSSNMGLQMKSYWSSIPSCWERASAFLPREARRANSGSSARKRCRPASFSAFLRSPAL